MTKSTPSPWLLHTERGDWGMGTTHAVLGPNSKPDDPDTWIASIPSVTPYCVGARRVDIEFARAQAANARLISAAPDLLAALQRIHAHGYVNFDDHDMVVNAITKATGQKPE